MVNVLFQGIQHNADKIIGYIKRKKEKGMKWIVPKSDIPAMAWAKTWSILWSLPYRQSMAIQ